MWIVHKGVKQKCLVEAALTVFKGECVICLLDAKGQAFRNHPIKTFQLCGVGNLIVTVSDRSLCLQDGPNAVLLDCRSFDEAEEWAEFLCSSVLANRPIIRHPAQAQAVGTVVNEALVNLVAPAGQPPTNVSPRKAAIREGEAESHADNRPIEGVVYRAEHPDASEDDRNDPKRQLLEGGSQLTLEASDVYGDDLMSSKEIQDQITKLEERLNKNHTMFKNKMEDKETELVRECKLHYKMDKAQVKADLAGVQAWLKGRPEGQIDEEEYEDEQTKIRIWLHHKILQLADDNDERLLETEKLFHKFKSQESEKMDKANKKIGVKIQILMERLKKAKEREKRDGLRPNSKLRS